MADQRLRRSGSASAVPRQVKRQIESFKKAVDGLSPLSVEERLRRVLQFAESDLDRLEANQHGDLVWELRALGALGASQTLVEPERRGLFDIQGTPDLATLQREIFDGIREVLRVPHGGLWEIPRPRTPSLESFYDPDAKRYHFRKRWEGEERDGIIEGVWNLLIAGSDRLRTCADCSKPFVARKRQEYCSLECSQRIRNRRKKERRQA